jgi:protein-L-isoaspartate(D-aspartate) O-methyltransferase
MCSVDADDELAQARHRFAEELRYTARVTSPAVVSAFATVPRERFLGEGPWILLRPMHGFDYRTSQNEDPTCLYHDILVAIDPLRRLNNGLPSLWARLYDELRLERGDHVVHVGAGTGYYTAILAELVGPEGRVIGVEIDPDLSRRATENLGQGWPQVEVVTSDGFAYRPPVAADAIIVNAGVSHLPLTWLDALSSENGRLLVPLTSPKRMGGFILITRNGGTSQRFAARFVCFTRIIPCVGGRKAEAEQQLEAALARSTFSAIKSLRRAPETPDETCWLAGDGWWLSTAPIVSEAAQ